MPKSTIPRREFLRRSAQGALVAGAAAHWFTPQTQADEPAGPNDKLVVGCIGVGGQGTSIAGQARRFGNIVAVCDVDAGRANAARERFGNKADVYNDYREVLDRKDIDVVTVGTPDHWHTAIAVAAMRSGKDVYCEKPLTLTIAEGQLLIRTVEETGKILQVGTQQRSDDRFRLACELVRNGRLGRMRKVTVTLPDSVKAGGPFATQAIPSGLDWDRWLGQAPKAEYCPERCHYDFRWWYEYSGGIMTDWGAHHMDIAHWGLGAENTGPITIEGRGELPKIENGFNTPKHFTVDMTYADDVALRIEIGDNGVLFEGDDGRLFVNRGRISGKPFEDLEKNPLPEDRVKLYVSNDHMRNFFDCVKSRKQPISDVVSQHRSVSACHLANISLRLGRKLTWDPQAERFVGDSEADTLIGRPQRASFELPT